MRGPVALAWLTTSTHKQMNRDWVKEERRTVESDRDRKGAGAARVHAERRKDSETVAESQQ